jgi:hypothetical protein
MNDDLKSMSREQLENEVVRADIAIKRQHALLLAAQTRREDAEIVRVKQNPTTLRG